MKETYIDRKDAILDIIEKQGTVKVPVLAQELSISEITVRRDLTRLEKEGLIIKTHGGASKREHTLSELMYIKRMQVLTQEKKRIGLHAAKMIQPGDVIFLDTGTTTVHIANAIKSIESLTVITNSVLILTELRFVKDINLILLGGNYRAGNFALGGPLTERYIDNFRAKYAFLGADGVSVENGATSDDIYTARVTELMMQNSSQCVLVTDHTKFGKVGSIKYASIDIFQMIITDSKAADNDVRIFEEQGLIIKRV